MTEGVLNAGAQKQGDKENDLTAPLPRPLRKQFHLLRIYWYNDVEK